MVAQSEIKSVVFDEVSQLCKTKVEDENANLADLGLDSVLTISLILALEERLGLSIPEAYFQSENFSTVHAIAETLVTIQNSVTS